MSCGFASSLIVVVEEGEPKVKPKAVEESGVLVMGAANEKPSVSNVIFFS